MSIALAQAPPTAGSTPVGQRNPTICEINTWVWLKELSDKYKRQVDLSTVPSTEWDAIASFGLDAAWLMGVWERSPSGVAISNTNANLQDFRQALPDFHAQDTTWHLIDPISNDLFERNRYEMMSKGHYVALEPWHYDFYRFVAS